MSMDMDVPSFDASKSVVIFSGVLVGNSRVSCHILHIRKIENHLDEQ